MAICIHCTFACEVWLQRNGEKSAAASEHLPAPFTQMPIWHHSGKYIFSEGDPEAITKIPNNLKEPNIENDGKYSNNQPISVKEKQM